MVAFIASISSAGASVCSSRRASGATSGGAFTS
jgi:hypothetical protein